MKYDKFINNKFIFKFTNVMQYNFYLFYLITVKNILNKFKFITH